MYTHTAEGQIFAIEQETGRLLWRRYFPYVHLSFTSPVYYRERLLVPQAGLKQSRLRCLEAATGKLLWEAPFTGSPSWSRQGPPVVHDNLATYSFGSGRYAPQGTEKAFVHKGPPAPSPGGADVMSWIYSHNNPYYPRDNKPLVRAWDLGTGKVVWARDFSKLGSGGNDSGLCLADGVLYDSTFFGYACTRFTFSEPYVMGANMDMIDLSAGNRLVTTGPAVDSRECVGAVVSNGRIFYTSQASGLQVSRCYGDEAAAGSPTPRQQK